MINFSLQVQAIPSGTFWLGYRSFLSLYWMTAPLAWLYAIPVERFASPAEAVQFNLTLLGIVSLCRVLLMTRVVEVLYGFSKATAFFLVMLFADGVAMAVLLFTPLPIFDIMGGIRMTESEQLIRNTATSVAVLGVLSFPVWVIGLGISSAVGRRRTKLSEVMVNQKWPVEKNVARLAIDWKLWVVAACSLLVWGAILPFTQPEQRLRYDVEKTLNANRISEAIELMSRHKRQDFPPHWDPPPRLAYANAAPPLKNVLTIIADEGSAEWVQKLYFEKLQSTALDHDYDKYLLRDEHGEHSIEWLNLLERTQHGLAFVRDNARRLTALANNEEKYGRKDYAKRIRELLVKAQENETTSTKSRAVNK
jgi:hypothetical protein